MGAEKVIRWWPPFALLAMLVLGWAVGPGSTRLDDWFLTRNGPAAWLLTATDPVLLVAVTLAAAGVAAARRRWPLAVLVVVAPLVAIAASRLLKEAFARRLDEGLAYPSGHATAVVVVTGMAVLVSGGRWWAVALAAAMSAAGMVGLGLTYHYFTDTVGGLLLGTAVVGVAAQVARWVPATARAPVADPI
ncbi:MAG: phosphoesterase PA-phosphatase [Actinobacteria bacterium]|nr:phosphoesterase PA-phosphatase [Actinomycetota bacterium]